MNWPASGKTIYSGARLTRDSGDRWNLLVLTIARVIQFDIKSIKFAWNETRVHEWEKGREWKKTHSPFSQQSTMHVQYISNSPHVFSYNSDSSQFKKHSSQFKRNKTNKRQEPKTSSKSTDYIRKITSEFIPLFSPWRKRQASSAVVRKRERLCSLLHLPFLLPFEWLEIVVAVLGKTWSMLP